MRKNKKKYLITLLAMLSFGLMFVGCDGLKNGNGDVNSGEEVHFEDEYIANYGEVYYFESAVLNGKPHINRSFEIAALNCWHCGCCFNILPAFSCHAAPPIPPAY